MNTTAHSSTHTLSRISSLKKRRPSEGFTLVELLLSITMLGILAALSLPQLNGIYERQKLTNTANEMVTHLKSLQNKALANNQDRFTVPKIANGPLMDCTVDDPYVEGYEFKVSDTGNGYDSSFVLKTVNQAGQTCAQEDSRISTTFLPPGITFSDSDLNDAIEYKTVSGELELFPAPNPTTSNPGASQLQLISERIDPSVLTYYICINQGRAYAQKEPC